VQKNGCVVMEVQDWIAAINVPEWQRESKQIFGPNSKTYTLEADYVFSTTK
jgi:aldose 1-epimerase